MPSLKPGSLLRALRTGRLQRTSETVSGGADGADKALQAHSAETWRRPMDMSALRPSMRWGRGSQPPTAYCNECGKNAVNCPHADTYWCQECKVYTRARGLHQNCLGGF